MRGRNYNLRGKVEEELKILRVSAGKNKKLRFRLQNHFSGLEKTKSTKIAAIAFLLTTDH
jgi:hypothetical protein